MKEGTRWTLNNCWRLQWSNNREDFDGIYLKCIFRECETNLQAVLVSFCKELVAGLTMIMLGSGLCSLAVSSLAYKLSLSTNLSNALPRNACSHCELRATRCAMLSDGGSNLFANVTCSKKLLGVGHPY